MLNEVSQFFAQSQVVKNDINTKFIRYKQHHDAVSMQ